MYEIGYVEDGKIVRGGIKAPLLTVGEWLEELKDGVYFAIPASDEAMTEEELYAELDKLWEERHGEN